MPTGEAAPGSNKVRRIRIALLVCSQAGDGVGNPLGCWGWRLLTSTAPHHNWARPHATAGPKPPQGCCKHALAAPGGLTWFPSAFPTARMCGLGLNAVQGRGCGVRRALSPLIGSCKPYSTSNAKQPTTNSQKAVCRSNIPKSEKSRVNTTTRPRLHLLQQLNS